MSRALDMDLVEVAPMARPPVAKIMDYGKFKFDQAQRTKESKRKASATQIKEMKYRPKIGVGDFDTKTRQVGKFLAEGHKVKVTIMFRGREIFHPELGQEILERVIEGVKEVGRVETFPKLDGRNMLMVLVPEKRPAGKAQAGGLSDVVDGAPGHSSSPNGTAHNVARSHSPAGGSNAAESHNAAENGAVGNNVAGRNGTVDNDAASNNAVEATTVEFGTTPRGDADGSVDGSSPPEVGEISTDESTSL
jgi:translation initiation factor IF-3